VAELIAASLKLGFLALTWLFIAFAANVIRTDIWGRKVAATSPELASAGATPAPVKRKKRGALQRLVVTEGRQAGLRLPLDGVLQIGRSRDSTLVIDDDYASAQHAQVFEDSSGRWLIEDLHSTNGTYVNNVRIEAPTPVSATDEVRIGRTHIRLER